MKKVKGYYGYIKIKGYLEKPRSITTDVFVDKESAENALSNLIEKYEEQYYTILNQKFCSTTVWI